MVEVDGSPEGKLRNGRRCVVQVPAGEHTLRISVGHSCSNLVRVRAEDHGSEVFSVGPADLTITDVHQRHAQHDTAALQLVEGDSLEAAPTLREILGQRQATLLYPVETPGQRWVHRAALIAGLIGFVLLPILRNGVGLLLLAAAALVVGAQSALFLVRQRQHSNAAGEDVDR